MLPCMTEASTAMSLHEQHISIVDSSAEYTGIDGLRILVPSGVYHPHEWSSTRFLLGALPDVTGLDVLEIGAGSGALALSIRKRGAARVVATDVSERSCAAMECNALLNGIDINVRQGDLFAPLLAGERFDLVIFNLPLMDKIIDHQAEVALCDPSGELLDRFLSGLPAITNSALFTHASMSAPLPLPVRGQITTVAEMQRRDTDACEPLAGREPAGYQPEILRVLWWRP